MEKTKEQLQAELDLIATLKDERKVSDDSYAVKLVEKIVFGFILMIATAIVGYLVSIFFTTPK